MFIVACFFLTLGLFEHGCSSKFTNMLLIIRQHCQKKIAHLHASFFSVVALSHLDVMHKPRWQFSQMNNVSCCLKEQHNNYCIQGTITLFWIDYFLNEVNNQPGKNQSLFLHFASYRGSGPSAFEKKLLPGGVNSITNIFL